MLQSLSMKWFLASFTMRKLERNPGRSLTDNMAEDHAPEHTGLRVCRSDALVKLNLSVTLYSFKV